MTAILDAGALLALEANDRAMWRRLKAALLEGAPPRTHGGVLGQAWRGRGPRSALLARALEGVEVRPLDAVLGRAAGELLGRSRGRDVIDAALVLLAQDGDALFTSDVGDLRALAAHARRDVDVVRV